MVASVMTTQQTSDGPLHVDVSCIGNSQVKGELRQAFEQLPRSTREFDRFWPLFSSGNAREIPTNILVCGDLSSILRAYHSTARHQWVARIREARPYILAFIRTRADEASAGWVNDLVRTSDLRVSVCRFRPRARKWLNTCVDQAVSSLDPESVLEVRYSRADHSLWIEFGDGLSGSVRPSDLGFPDARELKLETASVGPHPTIVQVLDRAGSIIDIDGASIRALLDPRAARQIAEESERSSMELGQRFRTQRTRLGVTQAQLAERSGLDQAIISKLESGKHQPRWDTIERYAKGLGVRPEVLLGS